MAITAARMIFWICSRNDDFTLSIITDSTLKVYRNPSTDSYNTITSNNPITSDEENWYCKSYISRDNVTYTASNIYPFGIGYNYYNGVDNPIQILSSVDNTKVFVVDCIGVSSLTNVTANFTNWNLMTPATNTKYYLLPTTNTWINDVFTQFSDNKFKYWINDLSGVVTPNNAIRLYIIGHFESVSGNYKIIINLSNCTKDNSQTEVEPNDSYECTFIPNSGYAFTESSKPYAVMDGVTYNSIINNDGTATLTIDEVIANVTLYATAQTAYVLTLNIYNCDLYNNGIPYPHNYVVDGEIYYFTLKSHTNFIFKNFPRWTMGNNTGSFALSASDKTIATIQQNLLNYITIDNDLTITGSATLAPSMKYGFISIYNPTYDEVDELSKKRFYSVTQGEYNDLSQYIISFRKLYVDIPQITKEFVYFGNQNTNIACNIITTNFIETDCGILTINELYNNSLDYNGVTVEIYLPFIGNITLNANEVYSKEIHLIYRTNPINGDCVAIVYSNNKQIAYSQGNVSFDIPINFKYGNLNNYGTNDNALYMCKLTPYIEVRTPKQYQNMNNRLLNNNLWVNINTCVGYCQFDEIELIPINNMNKDIYDEIITILTQGVEF